MSRKADLAVRPAAAQMGVRAGLQRVRAKTFGGDPGATRQIAQRYRKPAPTYGCRKAVPRGAVGRPGRQLTWRTGWLYCVGRSCP